MTPADMVRFYSPWDSKLPPAARVDDGQSIIDAAYERLEDDLTAMNVPDQQLRNRDMKGRMVRYAARRELLLQLWMAGGNADVFDRYTTADQEYQSMLNKLFRVTAKVDQGIGTSGAAADVTPEGVWSR